MKVTIGLMIEDEEGKNMLKEKVVLELAHRWMSKFNATLGQTLSAIIQRMIKDFVEGV